MTKQNLPAVSELTKETLEEFKTADKVVLVAYFAADDKESKETFTSVANGLRDNYLFGAINDAAVAEAEGVKIPGLVLYKSFDDGKDVFTEKFEKEAIETFAKVSATPLIGEVGPETYSGYISVSCIIATQTSSKANILTRPAFPSLTSSPRRRRSATSLPRSSSPSP